MNVSSRSRTRFIAAFLTCIITLQVIFPPLTYAASWTDSFNPLKQLANLFPSSKERSVASPYYSSSTNLVKNPGFEDGTTSLIDRFFGAPAQPKEWKTLGKAVVTLVHEKAQLKEGNSALQFKGGKQTGIEQTVTASARDLFTVSMDVYVREGQADITVVDQNNYVAGSARTTVVNQWQHLEITVQPARYENQPNDFLYRIQITGIADANNITIDQVQMHLSGGSNTACNPTLDSSSPAFTCNKIYEYCKRTDPEHATVGQCSFNTQARDEWDASTRQELHRAFASYGVNLPRLLNPHSDQYIEIAQRAGGYIGADQIMRQAIYATYPELSEAERNEILHTLTDPLPSESEAVAQQNKEMAITAFDIVSLPFAILDGIKLVRGGMTLIPKAWTLLRHPERIVEGATRITVRVNDLAQAARTVANAGYRFATLPSPTKRGLIVHALEATRWLPLLKNFQLERVLLGWVYRMEDLILAYPEYANSYFEGRRFHQAFGLSSLDFDVYVARSSYEFKLMFANPDSDYRFVAAFHSIVNGKNITVLNPSTITQAMRLQRPQIIDYLIRHESGHALLSKNGGKRIIETLTGDTYYAGSKSAVIEELIVSVVSQHSYPSLIHEVQGVIAHKLATDPSFVQRLVRTYPELARSGPSGIFNELVNIKIPSIFRSFWKSDPANQVYFTQFNDNWKAVANGKDFVTWILEELGGDFRRFWRAGNPKASFIDSSMPSKSQNTAQTVRPTLCDTPSSCPDQTPQVNTLLANTADWMKYVYNVGPTDGDGDGIVTDPDIFTGMMNFSKVLQTASTTKQVNSFDINTILQDGRGIEMEALDPGDADIPPYIYEDNDWGDLTLEDFMGPQPTVTPLQPVVPTSTLAPGQPTPTVGVSTRAIDVDVQSHAGSAGGASQIGFAVYENGGFVQDHMSSNLSRYQERLDHLTQGSSYRIEARVKNAGGQDINPSIISVRVIECLGGSTEGNGCLFGAGTNGRAIFLLEPVGAQATPTITPAPSTPTPTPLPPLQASCVGFATGYGPLPYTMQMGREYTTSVVLKNTGTENWYGNDYTLANLGDQYFTYARGVPTVGTDTIRPGQEKSFVFSIIPQQTSPEGRSFTVRFKVAKNGIDFGQECNTQTNNVAQGVALTNTPVPTITPIVGAPSGMQCAYGQNVYIKDVYGNPIVDDNIVLSSLVQVPGSSIGYPSTNRFTNGWIGGESPTLTLLPSEHIGGAMTSRLQAPGYVLTNQGCSATGGAVCPSEGFERSVVSPLSLTCGGSHTYGWSMYCSQFKTQLKLTNATGQALSSQDKAKMSLVSYLGNQQVWGGMVSELDPSSMVWQPAQLPFTYRGQQVNLGSPVSTYLNLPPELEIKSTEPSCPNCASYDTKTQSSVTIPLTCGRQVTYGWSVQTTQPKDFTITTKAVCSDGRAVSIPTTVKMGWSTSLVRNLNPYPAANQVNTITSTKRTEYVYINYWQGRESLSIQESSLPLGTRLWEDGIHHTKAVIWQRDGFPSGGIPLTITINAPSSWCATAKVGEQPISDQPIEEIDPASVPSLDMFPNLSGRVVIQSTEQERFHGGSALTLTIPTTGEEVEHLGVFLRPTEITVPSRGWTKLTTVDCTEQDCRSGKTTVMLPSEIQPGTYTIALALYDHARPQRGEHFGTIAPNLIQGTALESSTKPCTEATDTATYCTDEGLSTTIVVN